MNLRTILWLRWLYGCNRQIMGVRLYVTSIEKDTLRYSLRYAVDLDGRDYHQQRYMLNG